MTSCEEALAAYLDTLRARQFYARYPMLLRRESVEQKALRWWRRQEIGLLTVAIRHSELDSLQHAALSEFRLHQYLLCGLYDANYAMQHALVSDPAFASVPADTIHVLVGTEDEKLLAYFCVQPAPVVENVSESGSSTRSPESSSPPRKAPRMGDSGRPLLPTESEMFGSGFLAGLPGFSELLLSEVRELSSLIANRTLRSTLTLAAIVDAFQGMGSLVLDPAIGIRVFVSHADIEARRTIARLGMPTMFAPYAPIVVEPRDDYWNASVNVQGTFWPNLTARDDLYRHAAHFQRAGEILELPEPALRHAIVDMLKHPLVTEPRAFMPMPGSGPTLWTSSPDGVTTKSEERVQVASRRNVLSQ